MKAMPMRLRLSLLLTAVVTAVLIGAMAAIRAATAEPSAEQIARMVQAQLALLESALQADPTRQHLPLWGGLPALGIAVSDTAPAAQPVPALKLAQELHAKLVTRLGRERVQLTVAPEPRIWVRTSAAAQPAWVGIAVEPLGARIRHAGWFILLSSAAAVLLGAAWFARSLTRPLERLAAAAPALVAGEQPPPARGSTPPEVAALAEALVRAGRDRRAALEAREQALAEVSHDLRTPLARLRFALELNDADDPQRRAAMVADVDELDAIIGHALAWLRDGREEAAVDVDLGALLKNIVAAFARGSDQIALEAAPARVLGKPVALKRALSNLIDNALRHGRAPVTLHLEALDEGARIRVIDAGVSGEHPLDTPDAAHYGLGLAIVRAVAAAHRGSLSLVPTTVGCEAVLELRGVDPRSEDFH